MLEIYISKIQFMLEISRKKFQFKLNKKFLPIYKRNLIVKMAEIGTGVIVLLVLWVMSFLCLVLFCGAQGKIKVISVLPAIISGIVTIILLTLPRGVKTPSESEDPAYNYSYTPLIWILIFTSLCLTLFISLLFYLVTDIMEPRYAKVDKAVRLNR